MLLSNLIGKSILICVNLEPESAKINVRKILEQNGFIYLWYHAEGEDPYWFPEIGKYYKLSIVYLFKFYFNVQSIHKSFKC